MKEEELIDQLMNGSEITLGTRNQVEVVNKEGEPTIITIDVHEYEEEMGLCFEVEAVARKEEVKSLKVEQNEKSQNFDLFKNLNNVLKRVGSKNNEVVVEEEDKHLALQTDFDAELELIEEWLAKPNMEEDQIEILTFQNKENAVDIGGKQLKKGRSTC